MFISSRAECSLYQCAVLGFSDTESRVMNLFLINRVCSGPFGVNIVGSDYDKGDDND